MVNMIELHASQAVIVVNIEATVVVNVNLDVLVGDILTGGLRSMTKDIQKWSDVAMYSAKPIDVNKGPEVHLLSCNNDPLGSIAAAALMYEGKSVNSLAEITDEQRRYYLEQTQKNALAAPLEFVNFAFIISGVTRGFTHQMVRQRTATYTQESTRFAVKEDVPVGYPPSLWETKGNEPKGAERDKLEWQRNVWDECVDHIEQAYLHLVNSGMPAEDARGLLPTNLLTRINYNTSLRGLLEHSGLRLCTQAQFEWRLVWMKMMEAIREYGETQSYQLAFTGDKYSWEEPRDSAWQFNELSKIFKPICYQKGSCQFLSDIDRHCNIRGRVQEAAAGNIPSSSWHKIIDDREWMLDPAAARVRQ
jgi:flavin-dependent thymidylate synthase